MNRTRTRVHGMPAGELYRLVIDPFFDSSLQSLREFGRPIIS